MQDGNKWFYFNYDMRGSTTVVLTPTGSYKKDYEYDTFGNTTEGEGSFYNETQFTGATHDKSTGMHYLNARYYNPSTGRFLTRDSYTGNPYDPWTQNLYAYCGNNPVNFVDPTGHFFNLIAAGIGAAVGAVVGAAVTFVSDLIDDGEINTPVETYLGNTAGAAVTGLAAGFTCGASLALEGGGLALYTAGAYGLSSMAGSTARQAISTGEVDPTQVAVDGAVGAVTAGTLKYVGDKLSNADFGFKSCKGAGGSVDDFLGSNVPKQYRTQVKNAFGSDIKVTTLKRDTTVYRYYGGDSAPSSYWVTPNKVNSPISELALPPGNTAKYVETIVLRKGTTVLEGTVARNFGQTGGGYQYYVPGVK